MWGGGGRDGGVLSQAVGRTGRKYYVTVHPMQLLQGVHEVYAWWSWVTDKIWLSEVGCSIDKHQRRIYLFWICLSLA